MIILIGCTACGKSILRDELVKVGYSPVITCTTRPPRTGEQDGVAYHFLSEQDFFEKYMNNYFIEITKYKVANGETWHYGTPGDALTEKSVIIANADGVETLLAHPELKPIVFYIKADENTLRQRLIERGTAQDEIDRRLAADYQDYERIGSKSDFTLLNNGVISPKMLAYVIDYEYKLKLGENG